MNPIATTRDYMNDLGVPDWRNARAYPDEDALMREWQNAGAFPSDSTLLKMWRWEFLRRRDDYREAWRAQYERSQRYFDECAKGGEHLCPAGSRQAGYAIGAAHLSGMAAKFQLNIVQAPWDIYHIQQMPPLFASSFGQGYKADTENRDDWGRYAVDARLTSESQMMIIFDLSKPLAAQLEKAKVYLSAIQNEYYGELKPPRYHRRLWPKYLRILDARDSGETFESIFENIELSGLSVEEFDERADRQNWAASGRQVWEQAHNLMLKLTT